jgi:hypothetical protein
MGDTGRSNRATTFKDFAPIVQCILQFGGTLNESASAVRRCSDGHNVAVDQRHNIRNLCQPEQTRIFVCYNKFFFEHTLSSGSGDQITPDHYLNVVFEDRPGERLSFSIFTPAAVIFKAKDTTIQDFVLKEEVWLKTGKHYGHVIAGTTSKLGDDCTEVYYGVPPTIKSVFHPSIDAGYVTQSATYNGRS